MEDLGRLMLLDDFYGGLLTPRQRQAFDLHFAHDLSLGEVAAEMGVSRPGALDLVRRARRRMEELEASVGALRRYEADRRMVEAVLALLEEGGPRAGAEARRRLEGWLERGGESPV